MKNIYQEILDYVDSLEVIDTHEHLPGREEDLDKDTDILKEFLLHYFSVDLISAGLSQEDFTKVIDPSRPLMERWRLVEKYWEYARHTGYGRAIDHTVYGLYGIERLDGSTIEMADKLFKKCRANHPYEYILKEKCGIRTSLVDNLDPDSDPRYFTAVYKLDTFISPHNRTELEWISGQAGIPVTSFADWLDITETLVKRTIDKGAVVFKSSLAYVRPINYEKVTYAQAEAAFNEVFNQFSKPSWEPSPLHLVREFQDYMMHFLLRIINQHELTVQFHTGLQEGNGNILANSNPMLMNDLFLIYKNVKFDLFHISYPFYREAIALCKMFPNVFLDMCWAHIISPNSSMEFLSEFLDSVAVNKLSAFGGDYRMPETVYGHLVMAKQNISRVLARKVEDGIFSTNRACEIARMILQDNPLKIFNLKLNL